MLRPFGLSVPSSKISLISCFFRRVLSPLQRLRPQIMMSLSEWEAELKCSATGKPGELFQTLRRCSPKRSRSASQSHQCISNHSDDIWWSRLHLRTGKWNGHGWYIGAWGFVKWSEMSCVGTLSSEDDGRQTFQQLSRSFRQSGQDNPLGFCHAGMTPEGARGK